MTGLEAVVICFVVMSVCLAAMFRASVASDARIAEAQATQAVAETRNVELQMQAAAPMN